MAECYTQIGRRSAAANEVLYNKLHAARWWRSIVVGIICRVIHRRRLGGKRYRLRDLHRNSIKRARTHTYICAHLRSKNMKRNDF